MIGDETDGHAAWMRQHGIGEEPLRPGDLPLAGDLVAAATARLGVDRLVKYVTDQLGVDCGCPGRQEKLNRLDRKLRKWLKLQ